MNQFLQILCQLCPLRSIHAGNPSEKFPIHTAPSWSAGQTLAVRVDKYSNPSLPSLRVWTTTGGMKDFVLLVLGISAVVLALQWFQQADPWSLAVVFLVGWVCFQAGKTKTK